MKSVGAMIQQLEALISTGDLNAWESQFMTNLVVRTVHGRDTGQLSERQIARLTELYQKHFGDAELA